MWQSVFLLCLFCCGPKRRRVCREASELEKPQEKAWMLTQTTKYALCNIHIFQFTRSSNVCIIKFFSMLLSFIIKSVWEQSHTNPYYTHVTVNKSINSLPEDFCTPFSLPEHITPPQCSVLLYSSSYAYFLQFNFSLYATNANTQTNEWLAKAQAENPNDLFFLLHCAYKISPLLFLLLCHFQITNINFLSHIRMSYGLSMCAPSCFQFHRRFQRLTPICKYSSYVFCSNFLFPFLRLLHIRMCIRTMNFCIRPFSYLYLHILIFISMPCPHFLFGSRCFALFHAVVQCYNIDDASVFSPLAGCNSIRFFLMDKCGKGYEWQRNLMWMLRWGSWLKKASYICVAFEIYLIW